MRDVTVIATGASAVDVAIDLAKAGAHSRLIARRGYVKFASGVHNEKRSLLVETVQHPGSGLGFRLALAHLLRRPGRVPLLPVKARGEIVRRHLGPSSPWYLRDEFQELVSRSGPGPASAPSRRRSPARSASS